MPENTLPSFATALSEGADRLELDVRATADGHVVVFHDATLERTTDGTGLIRDLPLAALEDLDAGHQFTDHAGGHPFRGMGIRVCTLAALLEAFPGTPLNIEIKQDQPDIVGAVLAVLDRYDARDRTLLAAEEFDILARIRAAAPEMVTGFASAEVFGFMTGRDEAGYRAPGRALQVPPSYEGIPIVTPEFVAAAHARDLEVHVWTLNDEPALDAMLDLGVDGVMTDFPALGYAVLRRRGLRA